VNVKDMSTTAAAAAAALMLGRLVAGCPCMLDEDSSSAWHTAGTQQYKL
jgi:hypothetical protein